MNELDEIKTQITQLVEILAVQAEQLEMILTFLEAMLPAEEVNQ